MLAASSSERSPRDSSRTLGASPLRPWIEINFIVARPAGIDSQTMTRIINFAELFWGNRGNHNENTSQKFLPSFTFDELKKAGGDVRQGPALRHIRSLSFCG